MRAEGPLGLDYWVITRRAFPLQFGWWWEVEREIRIGLMLLHRGRVEALWELGSLRLKNHLVKSGELTIKDTKASLRGTVISSVMAKI